MMTFFPVLYEDEVLYSVLARYHVRSGNTSYKATMKDLFGSTSVTAVMDLPSNIQNLVNNMPFNSRYTEEYLIKSHTLFPFYSAFLPPERAEKVLESMKGENGGSIYSRTGIMASSITLNQYFKFCPVCAKEDKLQYGELYWHRVHQIPGVLICPKHHVPLYNSQVLIRVYNKHEYRAACEENCVKPDIDMIYADDVFEKLVRLAEDAQVLLNSDFDKRTIEWYKEQYLAKMMEMGFANVNGKVHRKRFIKEFINYYGEVFLDIVHSGVDVDNDSNWLMDMVRKKNKTSHPIRHLLLSRFLGISLHDLFYKKMEYKPFGDGPWPCLNAASDHYLKPVVSDLKIVYSTDSKYPVGTFSCTCGFVYTRSGPDESEDARYRFGRIKAFGTVWEEKLKELVNQKLSLRETARLLGVDANTVKKYARKLGLTTYWEKRSETDSECDNDGNSYSSMNLDRNYYREKWKELRKQYPEMGKTQLRQIDNALFAWLYRNDREWLNQNSPDKKVTNAVNTRVDWNQRDNEILSQIKGIVDKMLNSDGKPERITISLIGSKLGIRGLLEKHLDKLPKTKAYLDSVIETNHDFRLRRIRWAVKELEKEGEELQMWKIMRRAGVREEYVTELEDILW
ncbi:MULTISPECIES: TnsD family Tn7-like transposition protein [Thermoanaerobacterium]|uniref:Tn7-like transposition protein D n=2 Tax=Thermoanaerobacterium TaxID=28895 RepID=W9EH56_9THEO|nr:MULTISPECIES: TnsD family Tn7-like transposition protein [Thermoanaerobacterium]AFK86117.1 Tn7-like transposition protein D [Thermoanaerobacterium saccharolyticum JW/SL-YS485]ETO39049.1 Tn7-like transposition protein D [Thermoanaerobacterium aotearoense SCUT27]